jgi:hypothetical protein
MTWVREGKDVYILGYYVAIDKFINPGGLGV